MWSIKPVPQSSEDRGGELALCDICGITLASVVSVDNNGVKSKVQRKTVLNEDGSVHFTNLSTNEKQCIADVNWRTKYGGMPVVNVPLVLFADDSSGNKTLKWNKFESWLILLAGLPRETNSQLDNIHFVCTSNRLSAKEMVHPLVQDLLTLETEGVEVYDAFLQQQVIVFSPVLCILADNPMASMLSNHLVGQPIQFCRICMVWWN